MIEWSAPAQRSPHFGHRDRHPPRRPPALFWLFDEKPRPRLPQERATERFW